MVHTIEILKCKISNDKYKRCALHTLLYICHSGFVIRYFLRPPPLQLELV